MQAEGKLPPGVPKRYPSAFAAYGIIARYGLYFAIVRLLPSTARKPLIG
jgi:solute carrier family 25 (mitochondrial uncoupling protein), member 8/9